MKKPSDDERAAYYAALSRARSRETDLQKVFMVVPHLPRRPAPQAFDDDKESGIHPQLTPAAVVLYRSTTYYLLP